MKTLPSSNSHFEPLDVTPLPLSMQVKAGEFPGPHRAKVNDELPHTHIPPDNVLPFKCQP